MRAELNAGGASLATEPTPTHAFAGELAHVYPLAVLIDTKGAVSWFSSKTASAFEELCGGKLDVIGRDLRESITSTPRPEQSLSILSEMRSRGLVLDAPVEVAGRDGLPHTLQISIFRLRLPEAGQVHVALGRAAALPSFPPADAMAEHAPDALLAVDPEGFVRYANPAARDVLGFEPEVLRGAPLAALAVDADGLAALLRGLRGNGRSEIELDVRRGNGDVVRCAASLAPGPAPGEAIVCVRDVSASNAKAADLSRRNEELEHCVNTLAHDLRSPLVALLGFSRLLRQDYGSGLDDTATHFVDRIEQAGRTMEALIHDLLELSRIGQPGERPALVDPRAVLLQLAAECKPRLDEEGIRLWFPENPPLVFCDRTRLYQVFSNLIGNAIDHMGDCDDRRIVVQVEEEPAQHRITVRDFGRGIAPEHHEEIFEVFKTLGRRDRSGTGMGLAIVRKIAETHEGRAWVESQPGDGAAFHVTLPNRG